MTKTTAIYTNGIGKPQDTINERDFIVSGKGTTDFGSLYTELIQAKQGFQELRDLPLPYKLAALGAAATIVAYTAAVTNPGAKENIESGLQNVYKDIIAATGLHSAMFHAPPGIGSDVPVQSGEALKYLLAPTPKKIAVGITATTAFLCGCIDKDDSNGVNPTDLGEPIKELNGYVGEKGFGVDVRENIFGESGLYGAVERLEKEEKPGAPPIDLERIAEVVIETYLVEGREVDKYKVNGKYIDEKAIPENIRANPESHLIPESQVLLLFEKEKKDGKVVYNLSRLKKTTEDLGWYHPYKLFPLTKANDEIIGNSNGPEIFTGAVLSSDGKLIEVTAYDNDYVKNVGKVGYHLIPIGRKIPDRGNFDWKYIRDLVTRGEKFYDEFDDGRICYEARLFAPFIDDAIVRGSPDKKTAIEFQNASA